LQDRHDHLYKKINKQVIRSNEFEKDKQKTKDALGGSRVILCTLSMLSSGQVVRSGFTEHVPVETLIVDEASQVEIGDYLIPLSRFHHSLQKIVFIGDDKQCKYSTLFRWFVPDSDF
jgi:regulator of nonsense transcripts 1